ncbi:MAG: hypothetical protein ABIU63_10180 [Chitinophagaceae bacterium]
MEKELNKPAPADTPIDKEKAFKEGTMDNTVKVDEADPALSANKRDDALTSPNPPDSKKSQ